jgi:ankyrin repeat protein
LTFLAVGCKKKRPVTPEEFRYAVRTGDIKRVQELITDGMDLSKNTWPDWTPLHDAAACGHEDIVKLLIVKGAEVDPKDKWNRTPLILALSCGHENLAKLLINKGADVNATDIYGCTPLLCAFHRSGESAAEFLIAHGAQIDLIIQPRNYFLGPAMLEHKPLHNAIIFGYKRLLKLLITHGADVNAVDNNGLTPMDIARSFNERELVKFLGSVGGKFSADKQSSQETNSKMDAK